MDAAISLRRLARRLLSQLEPGTSSHPNFSTFNLRADWFRRINRINRNLLRDPDSSSRSLLGYVDRNLIGSWKASLCALGGIWTLKEFEKSNDLEALTHFFDQQIDREGNWLMPIADVGSVMRGYPLILLAELTGRRRYHRAVEELAKATNRFGRIAEDQPIPYDAGGAVLVDTLAMICPFLALYSKAYDQGGELGICISQLGDFIKNSVDPISSLPYHGYYHGGPKNLGLHGWGRGTGWYMVGLIDSLSNIPREIGRVDMLKTAFKRAANTLRDHQRPDGNWNWAILHRDDHSDTSTTALVGYSLARGLREGLLPSTFKEVVRRAVMALVQSTRPDGVVLGSLGECEGLGKYPQSYAATPWLQGATVALASVYLGQIETGSLVPQHNGK